MLVGMFLCAGTYMRKLGTVLRGRALKAPARDCECTALRRDWAIVV